VFGAVTVVFLFLHLIPGDPIDLMLGEHALPTDREALRRVLGLDQPVHIQYFHFMKGIFTGNFGYSIFFKEDVLTVIFRYLPATLELTLVAFLFSVILSFFLGIISVKFSGTWIDSTISLFSISGISIPSFFTGPVLIIIFSIWLNLLPVSGRENFSSVILPALTLGFGMAGLLTRIVKTGLLESLSSPYIITARAKGISENRILLLHVLKNSVIPAITIMGIQFGHLLAGAIITEKIFSWPGIGTLLVQGIFSRDYPLVQGCVLLISLIFIVVNFLTDVIYMLVDPRIRLQ
jgi:peptide/nickel transport system permease protein